MKKPPVINRFECFATHFKPAIVLLLILGLFFGRQVFSGNVLGSTHPDTDLSYYIALRKIAFYGDGGFSFWNPYAMCGVPLIAEIQSGLFYPLNIVFRVFPIDTALNIALLMHLFLLAMSTYLLGRQIRLSRTGSLIAAIVFCFCGPVILRIFAGHHSNLYTISWIPSVFLIVDRIGNYQGRRNYIYLGLVLALQILAGHTQYLLYTLFFSWLYLLFLGYPLLRRKQVGGWAFQNAGFFFSICIAGLITLPQTLPVYEMLSLSLRKSMLLSEVAQFSFPPQNLLTFLTPLIFGDGVKVPYWGLYNVWEMCAYCGIMPLILSATALRHIKSARHSTFLLFLALSALIIALGEHTPLFKLLYHVLPGFNMFRGHSKTMIFCCLAIAILAGIGFDALQSMQFGKNSKFFIAATAGLAAGWALLMVMPYSELMEGPIKSFLLFVHNDPRAYLPIPQSEDIEFVNAAVKQSTTSMQLLLTSFFLSVFLILLTIRFGFRRVLITLIVLLTVTDLFIFGKIFSTTVNAHQWDLKPGTREFLARKNNPFRCAIATSGGPAYGNTSLLHRISGDYPYVLRHYSRLYNLANRGDASPTLKIDGIQRVSPIFSILNLKYLIVDSGMNRGFPGYLKEYDDGTISVYLNSRALERVYLPQRITFVNNEDDALGGVLRLPIIDGEEIVLEIDPIGEERIVNQRSAAKLHPEDRVEIVEYKPDLVKLRTALASDRWVLLADTYYPGWKAKIDDRFETPILPANYIFRAVYAPKGVHEIVFRYRPTSFSTSLTIALITLFICFWSLIYPQKTLRLFDGKGP